MKILPNIIDPLSPQGLEDIKSHAGYRVEPWFETKLNLIIESLFQNSQSHWVLEINRWRTLEQIDWFLRRFLDLIRSHETPITKQNSFQAHFFLHTLDSFDVASYLALAGTFPSSFAVMRASLEYAGYAQLVNENPSLGPVWYQRDQNEAARADVRRDFTHRNIVRSLKMKDPALAATYSDLYEKLIDYGAHPNVSGVMMGVRNYKIDEELSYVEHASPHNVQQNLTFSLDLCADVGTCVAKVFNQIFPEPFAALGSQEIIGYIEASRVRDSQPPSPSER